ncbi:MAG: SpoIIIAH-like family protein, partial [Clostridia bacterium]|nr:SpoIIIAH-like family protein [Clostridia bacterium]
MFTKKKKIFIMFGMVALLVITGCLNLFLSKENEDIPTSSYESASFLQTYRASKLETRQTMLSYYESIIESSVDSEQIVETNALISDLAGRMEQETVLEGLITASGYEDCVVTNADGSYSVLVKSDNLTSDDVAKILGILVKETGVSATNVKIT